MGGSSIQPLTDREIMIKLDSNVTSLRESIERFAKALENLETIKIKDHEERIIILERFKSEWSGAYKIISIIALMLGIAATLKAFL